MVESPAGYQRAAVEVKGKTSSVPVCTLICQYAIQFSSMLRKAVTLDFVISIVTTYIVQFLPILCNVIAVFTCIINLYL